MRPYLILLSCLALVAISCKKEKIYRTSKFDGVYHGTGVHYLGTNVNSPEYDTLALTVIVESTSKTTLDISGHTFEHPKGYKGNSFDDVVSGNTWSADFDADTIHYFYKSSAPGGTSWTQFTGIKEK